MTLADFIAEFRVQRDDNAKPYLWSDAEILTYLNSAVDEVCERALLLEDRSTPACTQITLIAGQADYVLHAATIKVKRITYAGKTIPETSVEALDSDEPLWETRTGIPTQYVLTGTTGLRLVPTPTTASVAVTNKIYLTVYRTQLGLFSEDSDDGASPEVPAIYHLRMMNWIYRCALLKNDAETVNKIKAGEYQAIFEGDFGLRPDANVQRKRRDKRLPVTAMNYP